LQKAQTLTALLINCLALNKIIPILTEQDVADDHRWTYQQRNMDFNKDLGLVNKYCYHPFNTITVDGFGDVYMCVCQAWLPISVGKIWDFNSFEEIVSSSKARTIQASILDGSYRYCDNNTCSIIQEGELSNEIAHRPDTVNWINFAIDSSCNLTCPGCRKDFIFINEGEEYTRRIRIVDHMVKLIEQHKHSLKFTLSGDGDPFASLIYRDLLSKLQINQHNVEVEIITNGILVKAHWHKMSGVHNNIVRCKVSFDAGTEEVYNVTRRGGDWNKLLDSVKYLQQWRSDNNSAMVLTSNFVVQRANYKDMTQYVDLCDALGFDEINFQKVVNWGTFMDFEQEAVWQESHAEYPLFLEQLHAVGLNTKVNLTNLNDLKCN